MRVALRQIIDFAVPLNVTYEDKKEVFWKWYLLDNNESQSIIKELISKKEIPSKIPEIPAQKEVQKELSKKETPKKPKPQPNKNLFLENIHKFFQKGGINIIETFESKKSSEQDFIVELQTAIGSIRYFCKSKDKKNINDADLSSALIQAQSKNLPLLFLGSGALTKKAGDMLNNELKNIIFKKI